MSISIFLSTVSDEFRSYRDLLVHDLTRQDVAVKVQEDFKDLGGDTLDKLGKYIAACDAVVHLVGDMCGLPAGDWEQQALLAKYPDLPLKLSTLSDALKAGFACPYTQWEAWLALYHRKELYIARASQDAPRGPSFAPTEASRAAQDAHFERLTNEAQKAGRYPLRFTNPDNLAKQIFASGILDLLVKDYASDVARGRVVAEGFIADMAKRVVGDKALDLDGMKEAVRNAIEFYEKEIAGRPIEANLDEIVARALTKARAQVDKGQSGLARATLDKAAKEMEREEEDRREHFITGVTALRNHQRNYALAAYDGDGAAEAILALAQSIHGTNTAKIAEFLGSEADALYKVGDERGSNVHLVASIALRRKVFTLAAAVDERGAARNSLGIALGTLGERESGTARHEEAVAAFRAALQEYMRERAPVDWAMTQSNLGTALEALGERQKDATFMEEAVSSMRDAVEGYQQTKAGYWLPIAEARLAEVQAKLAELKR
jgi:tetratricopeptide (TPR) repeat protein